MTDSTNPRVMADNIKKLDAADQETAGVLEALQIYDDAETDTGKKWINGETIYRKVFTISELTEGSATVVHGIDNLDTIITLEGAVKATSNYYAVGYYNGSNSRVTCFISGNAIVLTIGSTFVSTFTECNIVLEYTKTPPTP